MTISYTLDVSQTTVRSFFSLLFRWRGSVWKAVVPQLMLWTAVYLAISLIYRFFMTKHQQDIFAEWVEYLNDDLTHYIPLNFLLGFFVSQVVARWQSVIDRIVWTDTSAVNFANFIKGDDEETIILRRTLIRYMVLNQTLVLRDISMQVRKRYPSLETMIVAGLVTNEELRQIEEIHDAYTRYWLPLDWCYALLYKAKEQKKICSDHILVFLVEDLQHFRQGLATLLKFDWCPLPLAYPQVVFLAVRLYFGICLISRQHIVHDADASNKSIVDAIVPIKTLVEFFVFMGWMKVAEALLNPLGVDDDDIEVNYILDKNLITGLTLVDYGSKPPPPLTVDKFYQKDHIVPLYSLSAAKREVHPLIGSASTTNLVKNVDTITMVPHKNQLTQLNSKQQEANVKTVNVSEHNKRHADDKKIRKDANPDQILDNIRKRSKRINDGKVHSINIPITSSFSSKTTEQPTLIHHSSISQASSDDYLNESQNNRSNGNPNFTHEYRF